MKRIAALTAVALLACAGNALAQMEAEKPKQETKAAPKAQAATLKVGDAAPALAIAKWVKGDQITGFEKGRVYVVEFWATWCGPCIASMPHLSELQKEYKSKGVTIIGVTNKDPNNSLEDVEKMVTDKGDTMGYTVAWDDEGKTNQAYMKAARQRGIPTAFVVDQKSNIAYIGHPSMLDPVMERVVDGNWDYVEGPKELKKIMDRKAEIYEKSEDEPAAALKLLESFEKEHPKLASDMGMMKYAMQNRTKDAAAAKTGAALVDAYVAKKDAMGLNELAWTIVDPDGDFTPKDLDLAMRAASEAVRLTKNEDGAILDTLARVYHLKGDNKKAIEIQTQAISKAKGEMKEQLEKTLDEYKNAKN